VTYDDILIHRLEGDFYKVLWCCSPACCRAGLDILAAQINTAFSEGRRSTASYQRGNYEDYYKQHIGEQCFQRFIDGLGKTNSMRATMLEPPVDDVVPRYDRRCLRQSNTRLDTDEYDIKLAGYDELIRTQGALCTARATDAQYRAIKAHADAHPDEVGKDWD
jgi:hypothetical protein